MSTLLALLEKKKQDLDAQSGRRAKTVKAPPGKSRWRILPSWRTGGDEQFWHDFGQHYIKAPGVDKPLAVYVCVETTYGRSCEVCSALENAIRVASNDGVLNALKEGKSSKRILVNALRRDGDSPNKPEILELPPGVFGMFADAAGTYGKDGVNILDLAEGHDVWINRDGQGLNTKYSVTVAPKSTAIDKSVLANLANIDEFVKQEYEAGLKKAMNAITQVRGGVAALTGPAGSTGGSALADDETTSLEAEYEVTSNVTAPAPEPTPAPKPVVNQTLAARASAAATQATAPATTPAPAKPAAAAPPPPAAASDDEVDALLAELDLDAAS